MLGVNGKPFVSLDDVIDVSIMAELHDEICLGLAMIDQTEHSMTQCLKRGDAALDLYDHRYKESAEDVTDADLEVLKTLTAEQRRRFWMIKYGVYLPWTYCVQLLDDANVWIKKHSSADKVIPEQVQRLFPKTLAFAYGLPMFQEIGRICIFGVHPNHHVVCHRDASFAAWPRRDDLVMVSPIKQKPFYLYDVDTQQKHYVDCHLAVFNDHDYHGADACTCFTYNFRIDGVYTPEWREQIKLAGR